MYKLCKTEQSSKRQRDIEKILLNLMSVKRFDDITVSEICEIAKMPRKAFYRYFDSKDGALHALLDHNIIDYHSFSAGKPQRERRTLQGEFEEFFEFWKTRRYFLDAFEKSNMTGLLVQNSSGFAMGEFINVKKFLADEDEWMAGQVFKFTVSGLMAIMINWYLGGFRESVPEMAKAASRLVSRPLFGLLERYGIEN